MSASDPIEDTDHGDYQDDHDRDHDDANASPPWLGRGSSPGSASFDSQEGPTGSTGSAYARHHQLRPRFESELARVLFVDLDGPVSVKATRTETMLVDAVCARLRVATQDDLHAMCSLLHTSVMPRLCAESALRVAIEVERVAPWMFDIVPSLAALKQTLTKAEEMTQIFSYARLCTLLRALKEEAVRA